MFKHDHEIEGGYRDNQYDVLRIISTIAVVIIHANWYYFSKRYQTPDDTIEWVIESILNIITRFSVPCFVMISGAFNLKRQVPVIEFYKKTSFKIILPTIIISLIDAFYQVAVNVIESKELTHGIKGIITGSFFNLWFIYTLAILYLLTPAIILVKNRCSWSQYKLIAVFWSIWAIVSQATSSQKLAYSIGVGGAFISYYILGDVISTELSKNKPKKSLLAMIGLACIVISYFWRKNGHNYYTSNAYTNFFSPTILIYSVCIFAYVGSMTVDKDARRLSGLTFYIYLFHTLVLKALILVIDDHFTDVMGISILTVATVTISCLMAIVFQYLWSSKNVTNLRSKWYGMKAWQVLLK